MTDNDQVKTRRSFLVSKLFWVGLVVALVGLAFNLGLFFVPLDVWIDDPGLVPMPEVLLGWWVIGIGVVMMGWSMFRKTSQ